MSFKPPVLKVDPDKVCLLAIPMDVQSEQLADDNGVTLTLKLRVNYIDHLAEKADQVAGLDALVAAIQERGHRIKLIPVSDNRLSHDLDRMQPDGSLRPLMEDEGTW